MYYAIKIKTMKTIFIIIIITLFSTVLKAQQSDTLILWANVQKIYKDYIVLNDVSIFNNQKIYSEVNIKSDFRLLLKNKMDYLDKRVLCYVIVMNEQFFLLNIDKSDNNIYYITPNNENIYIFTDDIVKVNRIEYSMNKTILNIDILFKNTSKYGLEEYIYHTFNADESPEFLTNFLIYEWKKYILRTSCYEYVLESKIFYSIFDKRINLKTRLSIFNIVNPSYSYNSNGLLSFFVELYMSENTQYHLFGEQKIIEMKMFLINEINLKNVFLKKLNE